MKIISGKVKLMFRNGIALILSETEKQKVDDAKYALILSTKTDRKSSLFAKIHSFTVEGENNIILLDKRIAGEIRDGDEVDVLISSSPPTSNILYLAIPSTLRLPQGDWSTIVREGNIGTVLDYGQKISFVVPSEIREPYVVQAQLIKSIPYPPVKIDTNTKIFLNKQTPEELDDLLLSIYEQRKIRAEEYEARLKDGYVELLIDLKNNNLQSTSRSINFQTEPKVAYDTLKTAFSTYTIIDEQINIDTPQNFVGTILYVSSISKKDNKTIVEITISGKETQGLASLWIYGVEEDFIINKLKKEFLPKIQMVLDGVKIGPEQADMYCVGDCGTLLNLEEVDQNGIIECPACFTRNKIPAKYRIQ